MGRNHRIALGKATLCEALQAESQKRARRIELPTFSLGSGRHSTENAVNTEVSEGGSPPPSHSASYSTPNPAPEAPADPELAAVVAAWPDLPPAIRAGVLALVKAAKA